MQETDGRAIAATITAFIEEHHLLPERGQLVVAVSGGADSLCLLHVLHALCGPGRRYPQMQLHVAHLDHQLRPEVSRQEAEAVAHLATEWGLPITVGTVDVPALAHNERRSLEDAARTARYRFLREIAQGQLIAVAHHQDDQVETLLLHWLRGGGLSSMIGLQPRQYDIVRPLLCVTHTQTLAYCRYYHLSPIEDASNRDPRFLRNRIRHELLPLLTSMNANFQATLLRNAEVMSVDAQWIEEQVTTCWPTVVLAETEDSFTLKSQQLLALPLSLQRHLLRRCTSKLCDGQSPLELRHYKLLESLLAEPRGEERMLHLPAGLRVIYQHDTLTLLHTHKEPGTTPTVLSSQTMACLLPIPGRVEIPGTPWIASAETVAGALMDQVRIALESGQWDKVWHLLPVTRYAVYIDADRVGDALYIRTRQPGDRIRPLGMAAEKKVQDVLVDAHIPRSERAHIPLFFSITGGLAEQGREWCVWVGSVCLDDRVRLTQQTQRVVRLSLLPREHKQE
jgi:tRNA(Ile)-lysidine synthase